MASPPTRRMVWAVRLVFYPTALALIAVTLHQRHAAAADPPPAPQPVVPGPVVRYVGFTDQGGRVDAAVQDGIIRSFVA